MKDKFKKLLEKLKYAIQALVYDKNFEFTLQKLIVIFGVINVITQIGFGKTHNLAAYQVSSPVSIYTFVSQIFVILTCVCAMRIKEKPKYKYYMGIMIILTTAMISYYIYKCWNDVFYLKALAGGYKYEDAIKIIFAIDDSVYMWIAGIAVNLLMGGLLIAELIIQRRRGKNEGDFEEGRA